VKEVQFPVDQSLPWMVLQTAIDSPALIESLWYCFDLYNDAAQQALYDLNSKVRDRNAIGFQANTYFAVHFSVLVRGD
jgi:hypothetical protein